MSGLIASKPPDDRDAVRSDATLGALIAAGAVGAGAKLRSMRQLEGGWSRHSYRAAIDDPEAGRRDFVVRVKPEGSLLDTDLRQEYLTYGLLAEHGVPVPKARAFVTDSEPFGGEFFVLDLAPGTAPNTWRRRDREMLERNWARTGSLGSDLVEILSRIHAIPAAEARKVLPDRDFAAGVMHWRGIQREMALVEDPVIEEAYAWLLEAELEPVEPGFVHGDYRIGNCLIEDGRIAAVLDWELAFFGDRRFDLGYCGLAYLAGKFTGPGSDLVCAVAERDWFLRRYESLTGSSVDPDALRANAVLGALMLVAILTTGVRVYSSGRTRDVRMAWSRFAIPGLRQDLATMIGWSRPPN